MKKILKKATVAEKTKIISSNLLTFPKITQNLFFLFLAAYMMYFQMDQDYDLLVFVSSFMVCLIKMTENACS